MHKLQQVTAQRTFKLEALSADKHSIILREQNISLDLYRYEHKKDVLQVMADYQSMYFLICQSWQAHR